MNALYASRALGPKWPPIRELERVAAGERLEVREQLRRERGADV